MRKSGWKQLLDGWPWFKGRGHYPIAAYSEFIPPPRLGRKPYGAPDPLLFDKADPWGWHISEYEEGIELRPGLEHLAQYILTSLVHLGAGRLAHGISRAKLAGNPYWPPLLAEKAGSLAHERYVTLMPLALSRTLDDKGRLRWTVFGGSEQGPARAFWKGFFTAPRDEVSAEQGLGFFYRLLARVHGETVQCPHDLHRAGFRILPQDQAALYSYWDDGHLPSWTQPFIWKHTQPIRGMKYLLTFRPFGKLPPAAQRAYLAGRLHLLPFPGSLVFWGALPFHRLVNHLPLALQIPLLHLLPRHENPHGMRVPQSGWMHEPRADQPVSLNQHGPVRNTYKRTHRWGRIHRYEDELAVLAREDKLAHVLFSTAPEDLGLYHKPMARNAQIWTHDFELLLDGPRASPKEIDQAMEVICHGGLFGYRFHFPPMCVGRHEVYWHRPLVAYLSSQDGKPALLPDAPTGYLTAYLADRPTVARPLELWPRFDRRPLHQEAVDLFNHPHDVRPFHTTINIRKLLDTRQILGRQQLRRTLARQLLTVPKHETLAQWLEALPALANHPERGGEVAKELDQILEPPQTIEASRRRPRLPESLTYELTSRRSFEVAYWKTIAYLAEGRFINKDNADCVRDPATQALLRHPHRDLEALGDYLICYYAEVIAAHKMNGKALVGDLPFRWRTDFNFPWSGGWLNNQEGRCEERDIITVIPGRDRGRAVIMADHYDTAYMADHYEKEYGGNGARLAAAGADDNHSATTTLMLAAPIFIELSRAGRLDCDIWLIHLTGEEFPADCLGARHLTQCLVEGNLRMRLPQGGSHSLARTRVRGLYVLDMVAHNNDHDRDVFQISPGTGAESMWLALQAHLANELWNRSAAMWNRKAPRKGCHRGRRSHDSAKVPVMAQHLSLHGEVRPPYDPRSTLYNTDGQIFSDAGIPAVLFMENYDINRAGYHDSHDTMDNIDLDYGAAVAAIAIESVARAATEKPLALH